MNDNKGKLIHEPTRKAKSSRSGYASAAMWFVSSTHEKFFGIFFSITSKQTSTLEFFQLQSKIVWNEMLFVQTLVGMTRYNPKVISTCLISQNCTDGIPRFIHQSINYGVRTSYTQFTHRRRIINNERTTFVLFIQLHD